MNGWPFEYVRDRLPASIYDAVVDMLESDQEEVQRHLNKT